MLKRHARMWNGKVVEISATKHRIELLPDARPVRSQPFPQGQQGKVFEDRTVTKLLKEGAIVSSKSEWASPAIIATKPRSDKLPFCIDFRKLNALTLRDSYPIPKMDECVDSLGDAHYVSTLDANKGSTGLWQDSFCDIWLPMWLAEDAFRLSYHLNTFQRAPDIILSNYKWKACLVYIDDVLIFFPHCWRRLQSGWNIADLKWRWNFIELRKRQNVFENHHIIGSYHSSRTIGNRRSTQSIHTECGTTNDRHRTKVLLRSCERVQKVHLWIF